MDRDVKDYIIGIMKDGTGGCRHFEMTEALDCLTCQKKMVKAQSEYTRLLKQYPEKFVRKEVDYTSPKLLEMEQHLEDRIKNDSLYEKHLRTLAMGSPSDKVKEIQRFWSGFYEKHTGEPRKTLL